MDTTLEQELNKKLDILLPLIEAEIDRVTALAKNNTTADRKLFESVERTVKRRFKESVSAEKWTDADDNFDRWLMLTLGQRKFYEFTEEELLRIREVSRIMVSSDEIAKNIINLIKNLVVGSGITCVVTPKDLGTDPTAIADTLNEDQNRKKLMENWDAFYKGNKLYKRHLNWIERKHRDGECIIRLYKNGIKYAGKEVPTLRFIDPNFITESGKFTPYQSRLGVRFEEGDEESVVSLHYRNDSSMQNGDEEDIPIEELIFDKANVDFETLRGVSSFFTILTNLRRISKNLVNVSVLTSVLSCIALVRKHATSSQAKIVSFLRNNSDGKNRTDTVSGADKPAKALGAGTVIDAPMGVEYDFPAHNVATKNFIEVIDKEIAHVGAPFNFPVEWLLCKESEFPINESSPVSKRWKREQTEFFMENEVLFWKVQELMGMSPELQTKYEVKFYGPDITSDTALNETRIMEIEQRSGTLSPQTWAAKRGRNWAIERAQAILHRRTAQPNEVMPGDAGNTNVTGDQPSSGQGGDGVTKKDGGQKDGAKK